MPFLTRIIQGWGAGKEVKITLSAGRTPSRYSHSGLSAMDRILCEYPSVLRISKTLRERKSQSIFSIQILRWLVIDTTEMENGGIRARCASKCLACEFLLSTSSESEPVSRLQGTLQRNDSKSSSKWTGTLPVPSVHPIRGSISKIFCDYKSSARGGIVIFKLDNFRTAETEIWDLMMIFRLIFSLWCPGPWEFRDMNASPTFNQKIDTLQRGRHSQHLSPNQCHTLKCGSCENEQCIIFLNPSLLA
jgi:hypothetical protein